MKIPIIISGSLLLCAGALAQGSSGYVEYQNSTSSLVQVYQGANLVAAPRGGGYEVELFYQPNNGGEAPAPIDGAFSLGNWNETSVATVGIGPPGIFIAGVTYLPGVAGGANAWFEVVGWNDGQTTLTGAEQSSTQFAFSSVFNIQTGDPNEQPPTPPPLTGGPNKFTGLVLGFQGLVFLVPEPSTYALVGLGMAALIFFRSRKKIG